MRLLVTGKSGQLAQSLLEAGSSHAIQIVAVGRPNLDISRPTSIDVTIERTRPSIVVNAAAYTAVDKAESDRQEAHAVNAQGAGDVAAAAERHGIPLIHISTDYVFDGRKAEPYVEADAVGPTSVYGRSKFLGEQRVAAACSRAIILRTAWVHSPFGHNFVKTMMRLAAERNEVAVVDDQRGSPTYAPHLAEAVLAIAKRVIADERPHGLWGVYHAAGQGEATWCTFAREIFLCSARLGGPRAEVKAITTAEHPSLAARPANSRLDCGKLAHVFGVRLPDWREGTAQCVRRLISA